MSIYFYQLENNGNWRLGSADTEENTVSGNYFLRELKFTGNTPSLGIIDPKDRSYKIAVQSVQSYIKKDGTPYRSIEELFRLCGSFFSEDTFVHGVKKEYTVLLTQTGTNNPTVLILDDSIEDVVITRFTTGTTLFTKAGAFVTNKAMPNKVVDFTDAATNIRYVMTPVDQDSFKLETYNASGILADDILSDFYIHLEVYN